LGLLIDSFQLFAEVAIDLLDLSILLERALGLFLQQQHLRDILCTLAMPWSLDFLELSVSF